MLRLTHETGALVEALSDFELIEMAVNGSNSAAFRVLIDRHYRTIYAFAYKGCGHRQDAEDIAQEVCIKVAQNLGSYKFESSFTSWLYQITLNLARDLFRKRSAQRAREAGYVSNESLTREDEPDQEQMAIQKQAFTYIAALPDDLREAVLLVAGEGLSHKEAGKILVCAEGTISWRLNKAKEQLARAMNAGGTNHG